MNVRATQPSLSRIPAAQGTRRSFDVTVSDGGIQQRPRVAHVDPAPAASAPTSTPALAATLTTQEQEALSQRFASLPRQGITSGVYDVRGRTPGQPMQTQQGGLLDVTG